MNRQQVEERVLDVVKRISYETANLDDDFHKNLELDSLDAVELVMEVEKEFNIAIPDDIAEKFTNGNQIVDYICNLQD